MRMMRRMFCVTILALVSSTSSYALCVQCKVNECWGGGTASRCYSYGSACLTAGACDTDDGTVPDLPFEMGRLRSRPEARWAFLERQQLVLASVRVDHSARPAATVVVNRGSSRAR